MDVPARRFYTLLSDMKELVRQRDGQTYGYLCEVAMVPHLRRDGQENIFDKFYRMSVPEREIKIGKALDLKDDANILAPTLKAMFQAKARFH